MAVLIRPKRWAGRKPSTGAAIDWGHPLAIGLVGCWLFNEQGGSKVQNLAGPLQGSLVNTYSWTPEGVEMSNDTGSTGRTNLGDLRVTGDLTVVCSYTPLRINASNDIGVIAKYNTGGSPSTNEWGLGGNVGVSSGDARQWFAVASGSTLTFATAASGDVAVVGRRDMLAGTRRGTAMTLYRNAKSIATATGPSGALNTGTGRLVKLGEIDNGAGNNSNSRFYYAYVWNRALSQSELQWLYAEPFAFLAPQSPRQRLYVASGTVDATVTAVAATATCTAIAPAVSGSATVTAVAATGTCTAVAPAVTASSNVAAVAATGTGTFIAPSVGAGANVTAVTATATCTMIAPAVTATATVTAVAATASGTFNVPTVSASAAVTAVTATASCTAIAPSVTATAHVTAVCATATCTMHAPHMGQVQDLTYTIGQPYQKWAVGYPYTTWTTGAAFAGWSVDKPTAYWSVGSPTP